MDANARFRDLLRIGGGLVTLAVAIAAIGALSTQGATHPSRAWVDAVAIIALIGVVFVVVGWTGEHLTHRTPVTEAHAESLRTSANFLLISMVGEGRECDYGRGHKPREAFHAHYPIIAPTLDEWDSLLKADVMCRGALKERVFNEAPNVSSDGEVSLDSGRIAQHVDSSTADRAHKGELDADFLLEGMSNLTRLSWRGGESEADYKARTAKITLQIETWARASQDWPETQAVAESYRRLEDFKGSNRPPLVEALKLAEEDAATFAKQCPTCRGTR